MGFFYNATRSEVKRAPASARHIPIQTMREMGCKACPLDKAQLNSPKMPPSGSDRPEIYILGEAPGEEEDYQGAPFVGKSGKLLRSQFGRDVLQHDVRIGNTIRCRPPENRTPELSEIECCRTQVANDIAETQPLVVVGAGNIPLNWATGLSSVTSWRGRPIVTSIAGHDCWYYPILHPSYVLRKQGKYGPSEVELTFEHDLRWIQQNYRKLPRAKVYRAPYDEGLELLEGSSKQDFNRLEEILNALALEPEVAIDLETSGLRPYMDNPQIYTCSIGTFDHTVAFPIDHPKGWSGYYQRQVRGLLAEFFIQSRKKIAHHLGFELEWLTYFYGRELANLTEWEDTLAMAHTLDERPGTNSLDDLTTQWFGFPLKKQSNVEPKFFLRYPLQEGLRYNGMDSKWTHLLYHTLLPYIEANAAYRWEYERKLRLAPALVFTQRKGVAVDFDYASQMEVQLKTEIAAVEAKIAKCPEIGIYRAKYGAFNPGAPDQVIKLMSEVCKRSEVAKEGGGFTSDEGALSKIPAKEVPSAPLILELRAVSKLQSTYIDPILQRRVIYVDDRIHATFGSMIAVTGRLNSEDPNMQNFPKRKYKQIRGVIIPYYDWLAAIDYGQIEARVIAMASEDPALVRALWTGYDIHGHWAGRFIDEYPAVVDRILADYKLDQSDEKGVRKKFRDEIKNGWVFPQFFGSSIKGCAANLKIPEMIVEDLAGEFWSEFRGVKKWQDKLMKFYERNLYVETLTGRRRRGAMTKNEIINMPIQGTAADIVTGSMAELSEYSVIHDDEDFQPNLNIHDDLTFDLPDAGLEDRLEIIAPIMCRHRFDFINVPIIIEVSVAARWNELKEIAVYRSNELFNLRSPFA